MAVDKLDSQFVIDGLGQGVLIFNSKGHLEMDNLAIRKFLGKDLNMIREKGWEAAKALFDVGIQDETSKAELARSKALEADEPVPFGIHYSGEYVHCWAASVIGKNGELHTMITVDSPDWAAMQDLIGRFQSEITNTLEDAYGHIRLVDRTIEHIKEDETAEQLAKRVGNFTKLIKIETIRAQRYMEMFERLEQIRTGEIKKQLRGRHNKVVIEDFLEEFLEELEEIQFLDPETTVEEDFRARIKTTVENKLTADTSKEHLTLILRDILRNAIMYSEQAKTIEINAKSVSENYVQIDVIDQGYGIREKETRSVFEAFLRANQPHIVMEFGYGLALYLCKHEVEAMSGKLWFISEEKIGSTFSIRLPIWRELPSSVSSSSPSSTTDS